MTINSKYLGRHWSGPVSICDESWDKKCPEKRGVYRIAALGRHKPHSISRICNTDKSGTMYIGTAPMGEHSKNTLHGRIGDFVKQLDGSTRQHSAARRYRSSDVLIKRFPRRSLFFYWIRIKEPWTLEDKLLRRYEDLFGELPPLNRRGPRSQEM